MTGDESAMEAQRRINGIKSLHKKQLRHLQQVRSVLVDLRRVQHHAVRRASISSTPA
jgi:hypothetical protein